MMDAEKTQPELQKRKTERIKSIDQFRGYTVLGMFVVNYLGHYPCHYIYHHNDYFLSYADTIMPSFMFVVGISFRFTLLKRLRENGFAKTYWSYFKRSLSLCLISIVMYGIGQDFEDYRVFFTDPDTGEVAQVDLEAFENGQADYEVPPYFSSHWWILGKLIAKSYLWETLAMIGVTQLLVLPFVHLKFWSRVFTLCAFGLVHVVITHWFNWQFFYGYTMNGEYIDLSVGLNNWMGEIWGTGSNRSWDGGIFGIITWGVCMLAGTLCYDLMTDEKPVVRIKNLARWGIAFLVIGYGMNCLSTLYDVPVGADAENRFTPTAANSKIKNTHGNDKGGFRYQLAASPVLPDWNALKGRSLTSFLAEPPFVKRPENRLVNYWMMQKRIASLPYMIFVCGMAFLCLAFFVLFSDIWGIQIGIFRTFGMNPLIAYVLHKMVLLNLMFHLIPKNSAAWLYWSGLFVYLLIVYLLVRGLEKQKVYIRL